MSQAAQIRPLLKKSNLDSANFRKFRLGSNLPFIAKVIEKAVCFQLVNYIETNNLAKTYQSDYKSLHCTETEFMMIF